MRRSHAWVCVAAFVVLLVVSGASGAAQQEPGQGPSGHLPTGPSGSAGRVSRLTSTAEQVGHIVHPRYGRRYSGMVLRPASGTLIVYRKPGGDLDRAVRSQVTGVKLVFKSARYSEEEMFSLVDQIMNDTKYWRGRGIHVNGAGPLPDGAGVSVMTDAGTDVESARLSRYYSSRIVAERGSAVPATEAGSRHPGPGIQVPDI